MNSNHKTFLDGLIDMPFTHGEKEYILKSYDVDRRIIVTDKKWFEFEQPFMMVTFIENMVPVNLPATNGPIQLAMPDSSSDEVMAKLKGVLMDSIDKLTTDKTFVPQAHAIHKSVTSLINLTRLEMQIKNPKKNG